MKNPTRSECIVVTGMGAVTPFGTGIAALEAGLFPGVSAIRTISGFDASHLEVRLAGEVPDFQPTDHLNRHSVRRMDRFAQFAVTAAREALTASGIQITATNRDRIAVVMHTGAGGVPALIEAASIARQRSVRATPPLIISRFAANMASAQVSIEFGITGPSLTGTGACASGTMAVIEGMQLLRRGEADIVIAGGAEACVTEIGIVGFDNLGVLSRRNDDPARAIRPFSLDRDGTVLSEGACVLILERADHAMRRNATALAEIAGGAVTSDGYHLTAPDPSGMQLARAISLALRDAELAPTDIDLASVHATASAAGDKTETAVLKRAFGDHAPKVAVSAVKSMVGHMIGAAGALAVLGVILGMNRGEIAPTINLDVPDPECDLNHVRNVARPAVVHAAIANGLGFGGQNAVVAIRAIDS
jgi:3-oxoacyl-[acyl-carrier-protein] synthase II